MFSQQLHLSLLIRAGAHNTCRGPWGITGRVLSQRPREAGARSGGVPGASRSFLGARIGSCPFQILLALAQLQDLTRTSRVQNDMVTFLCFDFSIQGL